MYVCLCNPFTEEDVTRHLDSRAGQKTNVKDTYTACSGGESMRCCSCAPTLKNMTDAHNNALTIEALGVQMRQKAQHSAKEPV